MLQVEIFDIEAPRSRAEVIIAGVDASGMPHRIVVSGFKPYVLVVPHDHVDTAAWLDRVRTLDCELVKMSPMCGFVDRPATCVKVTGTTYSKASRLANKLVEDLNDVQVKATVIDAFSMDQLFFLTTGTRPHCWIEVPSATPRVEQVKVLEGRSEHAPAVMCCFDLECHSSTGGFPTADVVDDRIEMIGMVFVVNGEITRRVMLSRSDDVGPDGTDGADDVDDEAAGPPGEGYELITYHDNEAAMLLGFRDIVVAEHATLMLAHNGYGFDVPYMMTRMGLLTSMGKCNSADRDRFTRWSSVFDRPATVRKFVMRHQAIEFDVSELKSFGVAWLDSLWYFRKMFSLSSYKLDALGEHFLKEHKHDVSPGFMFRVFGRTNYPADKVPAAMRTIANYCMQDCVLTVRICEHVKMLLGLMGLGGVSLTPLQSYMTTGQQVKSYRCVSKKAYRMGFYINKEDLPEPGAGKFQGATVLDASTGFHEQPVMCLDFASLYPTTIIAFNLCYSTCEWRRNRAHECPRIAEGERDRYVLDGTAVSFVKSTVRKGVVPAAMEELLAERRAVKKKMKAAKTPSEKAVHDKNQWALKIMANSIYGFLGVQGQRDPETGEFVFRPMLANALVAQAVTYNGRQLIQQTCDLVKGEYPDAEIVYGDSVPPWTPLLVRDSKNDRVFITTPRDIVAYWGHIRTFQLPDGKMKHQIPPGLQSWTEEGWTAIVYVIEHDYSGTLVTIRTNHGVVEVTDEHSLVNILGFRVSTKDVAVGTELMHSWPELTECGHVKYHESLRVPQQVKDAHEYAQMRIRDEGCTIVTSGDDNGVFGLAVGIDDELYDLSIQSMERREYTGTVYDLETENHHFQAGVGSIIVHNTDSAMVKLRGLPPTVRGLKQAFAMAPKIADMVTAHFPDPILLEFEKIYWPFVQKAKKRYATCGYEYDDKADYTQDAVYSRDSHRDAKGLEIQRRDNSEMLRDLFRDVLHSLTPEFDELEPQPDPDDRGFNLASISSGVRAAVTNTMDRVLADEIPQEKYVVTKQLRDHYSGWVFDRTTYQFVPDESGKTTTLQGHIVLANKINQRITDGVCSRDRPLPGDRISFVIVLTSRGADAKLNEKTEDPDWQREHGPPIDRHYYVDTAVKPITGICEGVVQVRDIFDSALRKLPRYFDRRQSLITAWKRPAAAAEDSVVVTPEPTIRPKKKQMTLQAFITNKNASKRR